MVFNENEFEKSTNASEFELENTDKVVTEIPVESEKESEQEVHVNEQPEQLRQSERVRRPPVRYGIDEYTNTANVTSHVAYQAV